MNCLVSLLGRDTLLTGAVPRGRQIPREDDAPRSRGLGAERRRGEVNAQGALLIEASEAGIVPSLECLPPHQAMGS
jgi:hypothetical protein